nr:EOG090X037N [Triops cancriformis]
MMQYSIHKERKDSTRFAKGMSQTFQTLHGLVAKGVKVELGIPYELWDKPSAEIAQLKTQCENFLETYEEDIQNWYFNNAGDKALSHHLCVERALPKDMQKCLHEKGTTTYTGYEAALYNAATSYLEQQRQGQEPAKNGAGYGKRGGGRGGARYFNRERGPPKAQQLHYCDVCKISCAGPQTYQEHLQGMKHKKKEAAAKAGQSTVSAPKTGSALQCELCNVTCTGSDAYAAHIRGAKHQKVVKLHTKLGKPIPSTEPQIILPPGKLAVSNASTTISHTQTLPTSSGKTAVVATPKINFLETASNKDKDAPGIKAESPIPPPPAEEHLAQPPSLAPLMTSGTESYQESSSHPGNEEDSVADKDAQPVGGDFVEGIHNEEGKLISFLCKLCDCKFNDPNAKEMHLKGRRHRLAYKKKVDPSLVVEMKPSPYSKRILEERQRAQMMREEQYRRREEERMRFMGNMGMGGPMGPEDYPWDGPRRRFGPSHGGPEGMLRGFETPDDRHILAKHQMICPSDEENKAVQNLVSMVEKALKLVSDYFASQEKPKEAKADNPEEKSKDDAGRLLKGVMRVGPLAKGLILKSDKVLELVVLCALPPTEELLGKIAGVLPKYLSSVDAEAEFIIREEIPEAAVIVQTNKLPGVEVQVTLTSPVVREEQLVAAGQAAEGELNESKKTGTEATPTGHAPSGPGRLDKNKCLDALAALRHAKWFQARALPLQNCTLLIRIMRDVCQRLPSWTPLSPWVLELLAEKVLSVASQPVSPGDCFRRFLECLSAGILLTPPHGTSPGLLDPCEKETMDATNCLSLQEKEDITAAAQTALRMLCFRQIHKILGIEHIPAGRPGYKAADGGNVQRKRRRDNSVTESQENEGCKDILPATARLYG